MDTQKLNSNQQKENTEKKQNGVAGQFGVAATAAGLSSAGTVFAQEMLKESEEPVEPVEESEVPVDSQDTVEENVEEIASPEDIVLPEEEVENMEEVVEEPQPITEENADVTSDTIVESNETVLEQQEVQVQENIVEPVNPDEIAEAILSEEQIDPNDVEMAEVINFNEIGTVYTVDGESYTAASFHDPNGEELLMVDVDDDDVFDLVTTTDGIVLGEANGMTVGDAEVMIEDDPTHIAQSDTDNDELMNGEDYMNDVILS